MDDRAGAGEEALGSEETTEDDEVDEAEADGGEEGSPTTSPVSRRASAGEAGTTPSAASKAPTESTIRGCTSATTERRRPEARGSRSTELTGGADIPGPDKAVPDGTSAKSAAGTTPGTRTERGSAEETPRSDKQGKSPSRKIEGTTARGTSQPTATWPSAPHQKQGKLPAHREHSHISRGPQGSEITTVTADSVVVSVRASQRATNSRYNNDEANYTATRVGESFSSPSKSATSTRSTSNSTISTMGQSTAPEKSKRTVSTRRTHPVCCTTVQTHRVLYYYQTPRVLYYYYQTHRVLYYY
ncbi:mucin-21-like [Procambarus clarkii]|uniref:mucin-21-like n=1 Tax=Procambarus clarkii TaxID=6728 RepID=UPI0037439A73